MTIALAVARHRSIRSAARELGLAPSVISRRLHSFEDGLGVSLFERRPSGVKLTEAGAEFLPDAGRLLDETRPMAGRQQRFDLPSRFRPRPSARDDEGLRDKVGPEHYRPAGERMLFGQRNHAGFMPQT
jgi:DNA-binding transcriptional LysR family regulator